MTSQYNISTFVSIITHTNPHKSHTFHSHHALPSFLFNPKETKITPFATKDTRKDRRKDKKSEGKSSRGVGRKRTAARTRAAEE